MSQPIDLVLDKPRTFRLTPSDWRDAARRYSAHLGMPVSTTRLLVAVGEEDQAAIAYALWAGCRNYDPKVSADRILEALDARRERGESLEDVGEAILAELRRLGILRRESQPAQENGADPNSPTAPSSSSTSSDG